MNHIFPLYNLYLVNKEDIIKFGILILKLLFDLMNLGTDHQQLQTQKEDNWTLWFLIKENTP